MTTDADDAEYQLAREGHAVGEALAEATKRRTRGPAQGLYLSRRRLKTMPVEPLDLGDIANLAERPRTRAECPEPDEAGRRACPWAGCRYHTYLGEGGAPGSLLISHPHLEPHEVPWPCTLDRAEAGATSRDEIAEVLGLSKERVRQLEALASASLREALTEAEAMPATPPAAPPEGDHMHDENEAPEAETPAERPITAPVTPTPLGGWRRVALGLLGQAAVMAPASAPAAPFAADERRRARNARGARRAEDADRRALRRLSDAIDRTERPEIWRPLAARYVRLLERVDPGKVPGAWA